MAVDQSVSLARRSQSSFDTTPVPKAPTGPVPLVVPLGALKAPGAGGGSARMIRILLIAAMIVAVAVAMYIFVKPQ
jgi:hypothetical protein